ncbi:tyrosine-type recombinase/integrase [Delftia tsuruhatensis]|uniref:Tyrosine-type recombinase/integrase n=1 Tax=Delftia tsuruhatensis TaxID=180282 RepID=A0AAX3SVF9_9BURK|nr:tyrosine-type recombinase/integrase [Delftia tsuruhatensis]WFF84003.1 tyrosine-type recombinase/integrase [Delftia tsuruhatensis]
MLEERKRARESSFAKVAKAYLAEIKPVFALSSYRTKESRIRKYLSPKFDGLPMRDIGVKQIRPLLGECKAHGAWAAIHVKSDLSAIFEFAVVRGMVEANPIPSLRGVLRVPFSESKAAMTREQIRKFYQELRGYRGYPETSLCLRLIALTACRPGEAADAEWDEFDFEDALWHRPSAKMKARRDHVSPLSAQAIAVLKDLQCITGGGSYLLPHRSGKGFTTPNRLTYAMRDMNLGRGTTPHCWRTTFSTWANENGYRPDAIERQLATWKATRCGRRTTRRCCWIREGRCCRTGRTTCRLLTQAGLVQQLGCMLRGFGFVHFIGDELPAVDILDHVPVEEAAFDGAGHPGDVPAPQLVGCVRSVRGQGPRHRRFAASPSPVHASGLEHAVERRFAGPRRPA